MELDMPLDIDALYRRVEEMVVDVPDVASDQQLVEAQDYLKRADPKLLQRKLQQRERGTAKIPWLVAQPVDTLAGTLPVPPLPTDFTVVASDGSAIPPDRHSPVRYYVLNTGYAILTYGEKPDAVLDSQEQFCFAEDELYFDPQGKRIPIEGTRLGILMGIEELFGLLSAAARAPRPVVAVRDGSLILWNLQNEDTDLRQRYLSDFLHTMDGFYEASIPVVSYISFPGSHDVGNSLRLMLCDYASGCRNCPQETDEQRLCRTIGNVWDRQLFWGLLRRGERSDIFQSQSAILSRYGKHTIQFFYLNVGGEIARIEAPQWVMEDREMLDLVHGVVFDQCRRSGQYPPYPPVLIEAHEQAVISTADRQAVENMVEQALAAKGRYYMRSAKDRSKRSRGV
jgi:hypothetical protein